jgi:transposase
LSKKKRPPKTLRIDEMPCVHPNAAGIDLACAEVVAAVPHDRDPQPVRVFGAFTHELHRLVQWLVDCGIDTVAMESTGVYWIPLFEMLEAAGMTVFLVNARHYRAVPGRKSDFNDAQWLQMLHAHGLLLASFRPDDEMVVLRSLLRHRAQLLEHRSPHILHMQKALKLMNIQLSEVLSDVTGVSGQRILRAIVGGERDPLVLAQMRDPSCKQPEEQIAAALTGTWRTEHIFVLQQSLELFDFYVKLLSDCDQKIEAVLTSMQPRFEANDDTPEPPRLRNKPGSKSKNKPAYNARAHLFRITGVDLIAVDGISESIAQTVISEVGTDMSKFPSSKHFASWLGLAPKTDKSAGKVLKSRILNTGSRAAQGLRQAAQSVSRSDTYLGRLYRAVSHRSGRQQAIVAVAHKLARIIYVMLRDRVPYRREIYEQMDSQRANREIRHLTRRAAKLGFTLAPTAT